ncbi:phage tail tape measure protein [Pantoea sp. 18069]|uniref:phage tail tape measure protein n=1 Tax=Pantoea sp. 18069 TaxID=2681415 RepID=UPI00135C6AF9|nr:phage tail tape measure protein [Pantoea sp. 18069]
MDEQQRKVGFSVVAENETKGTFQEIKADAAQMAEAVERSGQRAARGINAMGDGAEAAAQKLTREEGRMTAALLRATEQTRIAAEAGNSLAKAFEIKADLRGMDMSRLNPMVAQLRQAEQALADYKAQQSQQAGQNAFLDGLREQASAAGKTRLELLELKAAQLGLSSQAEPYIAQLRNTEGAMGNVGKSAKEMEWALRGVPAQFTDIMVSLQGGQAPLTVFLQQGGQLKDMFGGAGNAARALGGYVLGLVSPLTVAGAAVLAVGAVYYSGSKERDAFVRSLAMTGDAAGASVDGLIQYSRQISGVVGTQAKATEGLVAFVEAGVKGGEQLRRYTQTAIEWERVTGEAVDKTAAKFSDLQKDPLTAAMKLNEGMNFLTASVYSQIKALQDQGKETEAAEVAMGALDDTMRQRAKSIEESLGWIERAWRGIKGEAAAAIDAMKNVGRPPTKEDELLRVRTEIANKEFGLDSYENTVAGKGVRKDINELRQREWELMNAINDEDLGIIVKDAERKGLEARLAFDKVYSSHKPNSVKKNEALAEAKRGFDELVETNRLSAEQLAEEQAKYKTIVAAIEKQYADKQGLSKPQRDALSIDVYAYKKDLESLTFAYTSAQKIVEAQRSAGALDDKEYFEARRAFINLEADAQDNLLQKEQERYKQEKVTKDNRLQVEKGIADTQAKLDKSRTDRAASLQVLDLQATATINAQKASLDAAERSAAEYLATLQRGFDRNVQAVGWGSERRNTEAGRQQIGDRYSQQRYDLEIQRAQAELQAGEKLNAQQAKLYDDRLSIIDRYELLALGSYETGVARRLAAEGNWLNGVNRAWQDYTYSAANAAQQSADLFGNAFKGMEDAMVSFAMTGKLNFKSLANSMIADIVRTQARAAVSGLFGNVMGALGLGSMSIAGASLGTSFVKDVGLNAIGLAPMSSGGYTGDGGKYEPKGIVHGGEYVLKASATKMLGLDYLDYLNSLGGYASGGYVESAAPLISSSGAFGGGHALAPSLSIPSLRVELINKNSGQPAEVTGASLSLDSNGGLLVRAVIEQAKKEAVAEVGSQLAEGYGPVGQGANQRERMRV